MIEEHGTRQLLPTSVTDTTRMPLGRQREKFKAAVLLLQQQRLRKESKMKGLSGFAAWGALL